MRLMFDLLHLQQPLWLLALIPLVIVLWLLASKRTSSQSWAKIIDPNLLPLLLKGKEQQSSKWPKWLLGLAWLLTVIALADPVWKKIPHPIFQTNSARVIVLDLSNSMLVTDIKPSRMARARFKVEDILAKEEEGQVGLVVFAGDAFTASPLTRDAETIRALLQVLTPNIMPSQGSRADLGLKKAHELLTQAGVTNGQVLLITDGASDIKKAEEMAKILKKNSHTVSVLAVGTAKGGTLQFTRNQSVNIKLDSDKLHKIAKKGGGVLRKLTNNDSDLQAVLKQALNGESQQKKSDDLNADDWKSTGPFIILLLLPLAALAFRKGWLFNILITTILATALIQPTPVMADSHATKEGKPVVDYTWLDKLFKNSEQRASIALKKEQFDEASQLSHNPLRKGSAEYKKGNYEQALKDYKSLKGADARYNEGNALAKLQRYEEAIKAYEEALKQQPDMADAKANKKSLEKFLKQQQEKEQKKQSQSNKDKEQNKDQKNSDKKQEGKESKDKKKDKEGEDGKQGEKGENGEKPNQFSDANKALDDKKEKDVDDENMSSEEKENKDKEGKDKKDKADDKGEKNKENGDKKQPAKQQEEKAVH